MTLTQEEIQMLNDKIDKKIEAKHKHLRKDFEDFKKDAVSRLKVMENEANTLRRENDRADIYFKNLDKSLLDFKDYVKNSIEKLAKAIEKKDENCIIHSDSLNKRIIQLENWKLSITSIFKFLIGVFSFVGIGNIVIIIKLFG